MSRRSTGSPRIARIVLTVGVIAASVAAIAARAPAQQKQPPAPPTPPARTDTQATVMDLIDSMAAATPVAVAAPTPAPAKTGAWPVDAAGRTLINGKPVVGRVFVQRKVDGLEAYEFANVYRGEALAPNRPVVATKYAVPPVRNSRRHRGIMVQATLWEIDHKRSSVELRHHRPVTPAARLANP